MILLRPWWLVAVAVAAALAIWALRRGTDAGGWDRVMPADTLAVMRALGAITPGARDTHALWAALAAVAIALGLAGPAIPRADAPVMEQADAVVIAIDLSPSVARGPALSQAQVSAAGLMQALGGRPVGLILYGGEAYQVAAPTADVASLQTLIAVLDGETMPSPGTRPAAALALGGEMLAGVARGDLVVLSDGGGIDAPTRAMADRLARQGVRISTLGLDAAAPGAPPPDPAALAGLTRGGGRAMNAAHDIDRMAAALTHAAAPGGPARAAQGWRDLGPLVAMLAILPLLMILRRRV